MSGPRHWRPLLLHVADKLCATLLPKSWRLPVAYRLYLLDANCETELRWLEKICSGGEAAVDVGANRGYYAYKMARLFKRVYAFDINPEILADLRGLGSRKIHIFATGLSSKALATTLYVPVVKQVALTGWASLHRDSCPDADRHVEKSVTTIALDSLRLRSVALIKIDVEGHELEVLRGARQTLIDCHPALIVEIRPQHRAAVARFMSSLDYQEHRLEELARARGSAQNFIFLPRQASAQRAAIN